MESVVVTGRFINELRQPVEGSVKFTPSKIWVDVDEVAYPCLAPEVELDQDGRFAVELTRTDTGPFQWHYTVSCPVGTWTIKVVEDGPLLLRNLLPKRFAG